MTRWLDLCGWAACVVYSTIPVFWLLIHPRARYWRARKRSPYAVLVPVWIATWIIFGLLTWRWHRVALYNTRWTWIPAIFLFSIGIWIYSRSGKDFSSAQLGGLPEVLPNHHQQQLITSGIRSRVRHPVYLAHLCEMLAWSVGTGLVVCYALAAFAMVTGAIMVRLEDAELQQRFGESYRAYRENVPAVLPKI
ncbi:MAG TPA: isoprenylcysteine carboxylmethyltransferase family protein [Terriglobales bacterium]|jgi:protein-S-isoprenylcysteine O-methyltransferase Ste14|nr:isoprenylcysteine carboxylmethyltransferase family protein [Terriglobales bacterium]